MCFIGPVQLEAKPAFKRWLCRRMLLFDGARCSLALASHSSHAGGIREGESKPDREKD
jgi:hypothetical protein